MVLSVARGPVISLVFHCRLVHSLLGLKIFLGTEFGILNFFNEFPEAALGGLGGAICRV